MPVPAASGAFGDLLDPRFRKVYFERYNAVPTKRDLFYTTISSDRDTVRDTAVGTLGDLVEFTGNIVYDDMSQGYDVTETHKQFTSGFQIERTLFDDDQYNIMDRRPAGLATATQRTMEAHAARLFNNSASVDTYFFSHSEGVPLSSDSHTTTSGASTSTGFDNTLTTGLSAAALETARIQMMNFRGDRGERINMQPDTILIPSIGTLEEVAWEIVNSKGKVDAYTNNANFQEGKWKVIVWPYLTDATDWFLIDSSMMKDMLFWVNRVSPEFGWIEDFDTLVAKYRVYTRYGCYYNDWRWVLCNNVSG
jgi:hypothetical protein